MGMLERGGRIRAGVIPDRTKVEPSHLFRYVHEQAFRFNNRKPMSDTGRFSSLVRKIAGA
jgi:hypothetical protein